MNAEHRYAVLMIESDPGIARRVESVISREFPVVVELTDGCASARARLRSSSCDIIALDSSLPDGNSFKLLDEITSVGEPPPVILLGRGESGDPRVDLLEVRGAPVELSGGAPARGCGTPGSMQYAAMHLHHPGRLLLPAWQSYG